MERKVSKFNQRNSCSFLFSRLLKRKINISILVLFFGIQITVWAQPTVGTRTLKTVAPGTSYSFSHNQNTGSDGLIVVITMTTQNGYYPTGITYGGETLTEKFDQTYQGVNMQVWYKESPLTGSNTVAVTYSGNQTQTSQIAVWSFTNSGGVGVVSKNSSGGYNTEQCVSLSVTANSMVITTGHTSTTTNPTYTRMPDPTGVSVYHSSSNCCGKRFFAGLSAALSSGSNSYCAKHSSAHVYPLGIEIKESSC